MTARRRGPVRRDLERRWLLGVEHPLFAAVSACGTADRRAGCAITAGGDPSFLNWETKGDLSVPNEDAVCVVDGGDRVLLAVADAHFGHRSSHDTIRRIRDEPVIPADPAALEELVAAIASGAGGEAGDESETTLSIAVLERSTGVGFGVTFGDSTIATVAENGVDVWSEAGADYVVPGEPGTFDRAGRRCRLAVPDGALLLLFTDGVDGCGGASGPSVEPADIRELRARSCADAAEFARLLTELAIHGVRGHEGGRDNVAVAAAGR